MHWGLTAFERKRIERIALDHPYFDMHAPLLTKKELRTILAQGPHKTGPQVVAEVKKELGIAFTPVTQEKRTLAEALRDASFVPSFWRAVVLSIFCLLLALFMTFTVPGRAFAEEVYSIIMEYVNGTLRARNSIPSKDGEKPDFSSIPDDLETPQELSVYVDYPIYITTNALTAFDYEIVTPEIMTIISQYETTDGKAYVVYQRLKGPHVSWGASFDSTNVPIEVETSSGLKMNLCNSNDGDMYAFAFTDSYSLKVASPVFSSNELLAILRSMYSIE
jgi:hypothetical protein